MSNNAAGWRERAASSFSTLKTDIFDPDYSVSLLFFDLLPMLRIAHRNGDLEMQRRIYEFAEWCFLQDDEELSNAAGVAFYEHLFDDREHWEDIVARLPLSIIEGCWILWNAHLPFWKLWRLRTLCQARFPEFAAKMDLADASKVWNFLYFLLPISIFRGLVRRTRRQRLS